MYTWILSWFIFSDAHVNAKFGVDGHVMHVRRPNPPASPGELIFPVDTNGFSLPGDCRVTDEALLAETT